MSFCRRAGVSIDFYNMDQLVNFSSIFLYFLHSSLKIFLGFFDQMRINKTRKTWVLRQSKSSKSVQKKEIVISFFIEWQLDKQSLLSSSQNLQFSFQCNNWCPSRETTNILKNQASSEKSNFAHKLRTLVLMCFTFILYFALSPWWNHTLLYFPSVVCFE